MGVVPGVADRAVPAGGLDPVHEVGVGDVLEVDPGDEVVFGPDLHLAAHPYAVALAQPLEAGLVARLGRSVVGWPLREDPPHDPVPFRPRCANTLSRSWKAMGLASPTARTLSTARSVRSSDIVAAATWKHVSAGDPTGMPSTSPRWAGGTPRRLWTRASRDGLRIPS